MENQPSTSFARVEDTLAPRSTVILSALPWLELSSSYEGRVLQCFIPNERNIFDPIEFLEASQIPFVFNIHKFLSRFINAKIYFCLEAEFVFVKMPLRRF